MNSKLDAVMELARRYNYDAAHSHQVECLAGTLFMELQSLHQLDRNDRKLLEYAAILHDIGYFVSSKGHHRHALNMIMMEPWLEFPREEKIIIANLARYHRKTLPNIEHTAFGILSESDKDGSLCSHLSYASRMPWIMVTSERFRSYFVISPIPN